MSISCHDLEEGKIYMCEECGLELKVVKKCKEYGESSDDCACSSGSCEDPDDHECSFSCCGKPLKLKN